MLFIVIIVKDFVTYTAGNEMISLVINLGYCQMRGSALNFRPMSGRYFTPRQSLCLVELATFIIFVL